MRNVIVSCVVGILTVGSFGAASALAAGPHGGLPPQTSSAAHTVIPGTPGIRNVGGHKKGTLRMVAGTVKSVSADSLILTAARQKDYTVNATGTTRIVNRVWKKINLSDISVNDKVRTFGLVTSSTVDAQAIHDISLPMHKSSSAAPANTTTTATSTNASTSAHGEIIPRRGPDGKVIRGNKNQFTSQNWSGYATPSYATGRKYTSASGTWVVPAVTVPAGYSSSWVGIGGFCLNSICTRVDHSLIQLGTEQDVNSSGTAAYYAWYEMLPNPEVPIAAFSVNPGDRITASLQALSSSKSGQLWQLRMTDNTTQQTWSQQFTYKSSLASAEWIEEAPYSAGILPLANYGTATFDPGTVNGGQNPNLNASEAVIMYDPNGQTSNPSAPDSDSDGFNACWGSGTTLTPCSPSSS